MLTSSTRQAPKKFLRERSAINFMGQYLPSSVWALMCQTSALNPYCLEFTQTTTVLSKLKEHFTPLLDEADELRRQLSTLILDSGCRIEDRNPIVESGSRIEDRNLILCVELLC